MKTLSTRHTLVTQSPAFRAVLGLMSVLGIGASAHAVEKTWDGGAGTANWHDAANWSPDGIPAAADDVVIGSGPAEVVYTSTAGDRTVATLSCSTVLRITSGTLRVSSGGTISGRLTMTGGSFCPGFSSGTPLDLTGTNNSVANATLLCGTLRVASGATLSLASSTISGALVNDGTVTMSGSQTVTLGVGGSVLNRGEWSMSSASGQNCTLSGNGGSSATVTFTNEGTLRATGAGVKILTTNFAPLALTSTGSVLVEAGELRAVCNATFSTGAAVSAGATLNNQSTLVLGGSVTGAGTFTHTGGTTTMNAAIAGSVAVPTFANGTVNINTAFVRNTALAMSSVTLGGTGTLTLQAAGNTATGSTLGAATTVASGATLALTNSTISRALTNDGTVTMSGSQTVTLGVGGSVLNRGEWSMSSASGQNCILSSNGSSSATVTFTNEGTLRATGAGVKFLNTSFAPLAFTSTGSVLVE
ncbi:MAG: hypothetical protein NTU45_05355, partial [Planctomycetota bacterium]|nr:hypothetical protein [Planctomycetota bacterium]